MTDPIIHPPTEPGVPAVAERAAPIGPVDATKVPRYAGFATFARLPRLDEVDHGDVAANPFNITEALQAIDESASALLADGATVVALGGDHTIALPLLRAVHRVHGPIALLHFDAHLDTWDTYFGADHTHGTPFR